MSIKAIGFDLDDTLYSRKLFYKKVFNIMEIAVVKSEVAFETFYEKFQTYSDIEYEKFIQRTKDRENYKNDRVIKTYKHFGKKTSVNEAIIFNSLYLYFRNTIAYRQGAETLLKFLKQNKYELFILTNGPSGDQRKKLEQLKIGKYIPREKWFISDELNLTKPNHEVFQVIEQSLGYKGKDILYIGDDLENDIIGAKKLNWHTILLNVHELTEININTEIIKNLDEVIKLFKNNKFK